MPADPARPSGHGTPDSGWPRRDGHRWRPGRVETSLMLALAPGEVRLAAAAPGNTRPLREVLPALQANGTWHVSPNGILGDQAGASPAEGELLLTLLTEDPAATLRALIAA
jgi:mycofactocin precursor peptide peptidase